MTRALSPETQLVSLGRFTLESGVVLPEVRVAFRTWGMLDAHGSNAVVVCHALTGSADVDVWWPGLIGEGRALDPDRDFVVCSNVLGSCYGTTGPTDVLPGSDRMYGPDFPDVTIRDMVRVQQALLDALRVRRIRLVLGGSLGGMQALEWAILDPQRVEAAAVLAAPGRHSAWCIGWSEAQRQAIAADPHWNGGRYSAPPAAGLAAARMIAVCTYRSRASFELRHGRKTEASGILSIESYLRYQGKKLVDRFDANTYVTLTRAMDSHDVGRDRGGYQDALRAVQPLVLVMAIDSDVLYPPEEQEELARLIPHAGFARLHSPHGHDAFLIEREDVNGLLARFRAQSESHQWAQVCAPEQRAPITEGTVTS